MRKILSSRLFRISILVIWVIMIFSGSKNTNGFSRFGLWTQTKNETVVKNTYIPKETMTDVIVEILATHNKINDGLRMIGNSNKFSDGEVNSIPAFLSSSQRLLYTDILTYLENTNNKELALDSFSSQLEHYKWLGTDYTLDLENIIQESTAMYESCTSQKTLADTMFYQGLNGGSESEMLQGLSDAHVSGACQTKARIEINARKAMLSRVNKIQVAMTTLSTVLTQNRTTIIDNFQLFKNNNLEKLLAVRNELRSANPGATTN